MNFPLLAPGYLAERSRRAHDAGVYWEVRAGQLRFEHLSKAVLPQEFGLKAVEVKFILCLEEGMKKRDTLNVIPMVMRDQNMRFDLVPGVRLHPVIAQHPQAGAAVQDELRSARRGQFEARRVSAVAPSVAIKRWRRTANSPEGQLGYVMGHR